MEELRENLRALQGMHAEGLLDVDEMRVMKAQYLCEPWGRMVLVSEHDRDVGRITCACTL